MDVIQLLAIKNKYKLLSTYNGDIFNFSKLIRVEPTVYVASGYLNDRYPVVIKCYKDKYTNTQDEIEMYNIFDDIIEDFLWYRSDFEYKETPILMMEKLESINLYDDECEIAIDVLELLRYMHKHCVHNGIKPDNILKRDDGKYFLIDYGSVANIKKDYGYIRRSWSKLWACQYEMKGQITTPKHDFIELGFTMQFLNLNKCEHYDINHEYISISSEKYSMYKDNFNKNITYLDDINPKRIQRNMRNIKKYMNLVRSIDKRNIPDDIYDQLIDILSQ